MRVTNKMITDMVVQNLSKNSERLLRLQTIMSSGKRINQPSDDPLGVTKDLGYRTQLSDQAQFRINIEHGKSWLTTTDSVLNQMNNLISKTKEIAIRMSNDTQDEASRQAGAEEVKNIFSQMFKLANTQFQKRYIFSGHETLTPTVKQAFAGISYQGDSGEIKIRVDQISYMGINLIGSDFLTAPLVVLGEDVDLNPGIDSNTLLSDLNAGQGVDLSPGRFIIRNQDGSITATIDLTGATTLGDVVSMINTQAQAQGITNFTASISPVGNCLRLEDTNDPPLGLFVEEEVAGETTAFDLGISGEVGQVMDGEDLNPILTLNTPLSLLYAGVGIDLGHIRIAHGDLIADLDLSSAVTVGDVLDAINNSATSVVASINSANTGISVEPTTVTDSLIISDLDGELTATNLGIAGSPDMFGNLLVLQYALEDNDRDRIASTIEILKLSLDVVLNSRSEVGAKVDRLETDYDRLLELELTTTELLSEVEDADILKIATDLATSEVLYQAALQAAAQVIQPSLLNFIR